MNKLFYFLSKNKWIILILLLATLLRFFHLDYQSLWLDEVLTMNSANPNLNLEEFYDHVLFWEYIPHFYFLICKALTFVFGYTVFVVRAVSAFFGVAAVFSIYKLGSLLYNKKTGNIAALFLSVNYLHLFYSQEARPYSILIFFTVISFYFLVKFIKKPSYKNAILHGVMAAFVIHSHFFGLLTVFSQYIILLLFFFIVSNNQKLIYFKKAALGFCIFVLLLLPLIEPFIRMAKIDSFWLEQPNGESLSIIIKTFFGNSEWVLLMVYILIGYFVFVLFKQKGTYSSFNQIVSNKKIFAFFILFPWILISFFIPFIRSYIDVSMVIPRYFVNTIPAVILILAFAISAINTKLLKRTVVVLFVVFSLFNLFLEKKYYTTISKTQLKEITSEINDKNLNNAIIVTYYGWIYNYFFKDNPNQKIEYSDLHNYIEGLKTNKYKLEPFWYSDFNYRPFTISDEEKAYLELNFTLEENINYFDTWAHYYVPKKSTVD